MPESLFNLVPIEVPESERPPMYRSKHDPKTKITGSTFGTHGTTQLLGVGAVKKQPSATFGKPLNASMPDPNRYLKGGEKCKVVPKRVDVDPYNRLEDGPAKTTVPRRNERPVMGIKTTKNFITANAVEAILQVPRLKKAPEPDYLKKADYAQVPAYLSQVKEEIRRENEMIDQYVKEQMGYTGGAPVAEETNEVLEVLPDAERYALVDALKAKWDTVNAKYQKMTHNVNLDTVGKVKRKEAMETELKMLEADISKLEKPQPIYIRN